MLFIAISRKQNHVRKSPGTGMSTMPMLLLLLMSLLLPSCASLTQSNEQQPADSTEPGCITRIVLPVLKAEHGFYVAPDGGTEGDGSHERPWDLAGALAGNYPINPGDML